MIRRHESHHGRRPRSVLLVLAAAAPSARQRVRAGRALPGRFLAVPARLALASGETIGTLNGAIQEYHYLPHRGVPLGAVGQRDRHLDAWVAGDEDGKPYLEQHLVNDLPAQLSPALRDRRPRVGRLHRRGEGAAAGPRRHGRASSSATTPTATTTCSRSPAASRRAWRCACRSRRRSAWPSGASWAAPPFPYDTKQLLRACGWRTRARASAPTSTASWCSRPTDAELPQRARPGWPRTSPRASRTSASAPAPTRGRAIDRRIRAREAELARLRAANPQPKLWKKFDTPKFGAGRNVRFGDLDGDGAPDMLIAQNIPRVRGDAFDHISASPRSRSTARSSGSSAGPTRATACSPTTRPSRSTTSTATARNDVVLVQDFKLQVLDGAHRQGRSAGSGCRPCRPPQPPGPTSSTAATRIVFVNLTGRHRARRDILLKDRYRNFWVFDRDLKPLWQGADDTGHYPYPVRRRRRRPRRALHRLRAVGPHGQAALEPRRRAEGPRRRASPSATSPTIRRRRRASTGRGSDEGFLMLDLRGIDPEARRASATRQTAPSASSAPTCPACSTSPSTSGRTPASSRLFDHDGNLLQQGEPIHTRQPHAAGELARRRPGVRPALRATSARAAWSTATSAAW